ncbi:transmembrane protein 11 homolog, mitochondrial isoform X2 [Lutzomyia longipalpis]|uniref:transmembrane protein 11 homolog, mitochondrial isoform X2 n=1 Tax=Lutzomyia longipalpis TaxID=7200 RepID=UPI0024840FCF|nr:transmembrane protein 11 homolog, mitochondrial isoform X2 [Lutzomyia longipalpis]
MDFSEGKRLSPIDEHQPTVFIVKEVYDDGNAQENFESELDKALYARFKYIIIEPPRLGEETARWITVGNLLHKTSVVSGIASIATGCLLPKRFIITFPLCVVSIIFTSLYTVSWHYDPCCQYQVEKDRKTLERITMQGKDTALPVVLVYSENTVQCYVQRTVTILAAAFCAWRFYVSLK